METNTNINTSTKKSNTGLIIGGIILIIAAFFVGKSYGASHAATPATGGASAYRTGAAGGFAGRTGGAATVGQVVSMDATSITVSVPNGGGSKIILYTPTTTVLKTAQAATSDITVGSTITATGTTNSDGSITATSIQIRPAGSMIPGTNGAASAAASATTTQ